MVKVEVLEQFTLVRFDELKNIQRKAKEEQGRLFVGDVFECTQDMANYLLGENRLQKAFVKVVEIIPEKEEAIHGKEVVIELKEKPKKTTTKKATNSKKSVAKK